MATRKAAKAPSNETTSPAPSAAQDNIDVLEEVPLTASIELGRTRITLDQALEIGEQSLIELDKQVGEPVDILINGRLFARGEVVTVGENFGVRLIEIVEEGRDTG
jgi:flagellar motor switch protein FliN/FliY